MIQIFRGKEPYLHLFFVDYENRRFYKYWTKKHKNRFDKEVEVYRALEGTGLTPKLYSHRETGSYCILELEFLPFRPIWGFGRVNDEGGFTSEQKRSIKSQFSNFCKVLKTADLIDKDDLFDFEVTQNNMLYDNENDKVYFYDFEYRAKRETLQFIENYVSGIISDLPETNPSYSSITEQFVQNVWVENKEQGQKVIDLWVPEAYYHSLYINDTLLPGQREHYSNRFRNFQIDPRDFENKVVYDVGCNVGGNLPYYCELGAEKVIGVESSKTAAVVAREYIKYLKGFSDIYNIEYINGDATAVDYGDADTIFYMSCHAHFGSKEYHQKLAKNARIIYIEGHARGEQEKALIERFLPDFGAEWQWQFLGWTNESRTSSEMNRPIFKGCR